jgi:putative oxidoreductase
MDPPGQARGRTAGVSMRAAERYLVTFIRVYLGAFNLASGSNYFLRVWPQPIPADSTGATYMQVTQELGLFQLAKLIELVAGFCLTFNLFVPAALVVLFPISVTVLVMNAFFSPLAHVVMSGTRNFVFHLLLLAAYAGYYFPLLAPLAKLRPLWRRGEPRDG